MKFIENIKLAIAYYRRHEAASHHGDTELCPNCKGFGYRYDRGLWAFQVHCERCNGTGHSPILTEGDNAAHAASEGVTA